MSEEKKGLDAAFFLELDSMADKTGFRISAVEEERCCGRSTLTQISEAGTEYTGAVLIRLMPKQQPRQEGKG